MQTIEELFAAADTDPPPEGPLRLALPTAELFELERMGEGWKATYYGPAGSTVAVQRVVATLEGALSAFEEGLSGRDREAAIAVAANVVPLVRRRETDEDRDPVSVNWTPALPVVWRESTLPRLPDEPRAYLSDFGPLMLQLLPERGGYSWCITPLGFAFSRDSEKPHETPEEAADALMLALPEAVAEFRAFRLSLIPELPADEGAAAVSNIVHFPRFPKPGEAPADWNGRIEWSEPLLDKGRESRSAYFGPLFLTLLQSEDRTRFRWSIDEPEGNEVLLSGEVAARTWQEAAPALLNRIPDALALYRDGLNASLDKLEAIARAAAEQARRAED